MPNPKRQKVHYTITEELLPEMMGVEHAGKFYVAKAEGTVWYVCSNGALVSLTELLQNGKPVSPPRHGRDGKDGQRGDKGDRGKDAICICKNGRDGQNSTVPGPVGPQGRAGRDCTCRTEGVEQRIALAEANTANTCAELAALKQEFALLRDAFVSSSKKSSDYLEWLRSRVAERNKK